MPGKKIRMQETRCEGCSYYVGDQGQAQHFIYLYRFNISKLSLKISTPFLNVLISVSLNTIQLLRLVGCVLNFKYCPSLLAVMKSSHQKQHVAERALILLVQVKTHH